MEHSEQKPDHTIHKKSEHEKNLVLYNDNINTFEDIILALIEVCHHSPEQAEQCAVIAHYKGKCSVLSGSYAQLKLAEARMIHRNITVKIE